MTKKGNVVLYLDKELVSKSKELGFNLSRTFENHLKQLISQRSNNQSTHNGASTENKNLWWAEPDSDRRPSARQADVLTRLDDRPTVCIFFYNISLYSQFVL
jgi:CRP-like cAMP-binding protein